MNCPACKVVMIVVEREEIELDYCIACRGMWFDAGEIELFAERFARGVTVTSMGIGSAPAGVDPRRLCPRCDQKLEKVAVGAAGRIEIDRCPRQHGLWLDHRELGALLDSVQPGAGNAPLFKFLGETFRIAT